MKLVVKVTLDMALRVSFPVREIGNTVPYPPLVDDVRVNHGFVDLRGRPDLVDTVPEVQESIALRKLLLVPSDPASQYMSLGCDLGERRDKKRQLNRLRVAGGYIQVVRLPFEDFDKEIAVATARAIENQLRADINEFMWEVRFELALTAFTFTSRIETCTIWIWFFASASMADKARISREALISSLVVGFKQATK